MKNSLTKFLRLEVLVILLLVLSQGVQASHFHAALDAGAAGVTGRYDFVTTSHRFQVHSTATDATALRHLSPHSDFGCTICWAMHAGTSSLNASAAPLHAIAAFPGEPMPPVPPLPSPRQSTGPPRAPPIAG